MKQHCDVCDRDVLVTWETADNRRVCSGCIGDALRVSSQVEDEQDWAVWWAAFCASLERHHPGEVT